MSIFKQDRECKRMIFNIDADLAERLERIKDQAKSFEKRLDVDTTVNKALDKFVKKAEKKLEEMRHEAKDRKPKLPHGALSAGSPLTGDSDESAPGDGADAPRDDTPDPAA